MENRLKYMLVVFSVSVIFLFLAAHSATAQETIYVDSDYTLQENMSFANRHGFVITADNITIDGNGFCIDGITPECDDQSTIHYGIYNQGYDNVTIINLEVRNFYSGIVLTYDSTTGDIVYHNTIDSCNIHHNGLDSVDWTESHGIKLIGVSDSTVSHCEIHHNLGTGTACEDGGNGLFLMGTSSGDGGKRNTIINNHIYNNSKGGFFTKQQPQYTLVANNTITGNGQGGIILRCKLSNDHIIEHNTVTQNYGTGIFIGGSYNIIRNNIVQDNLDGSKYTGVVGDHGTGIDLGRSDGSFNNTLINNIICGNDYVDVDAFDTNQNTGNAGRGNTGNTAQNYYDDNQSENAPFTYTCSTQQGQPTAGPSTPGMALPLFILSVSFVVLLIHHRKRRD